MIQLFKEWKYSLFYYSKILQDKTGYTGYYLSQIVIKDYKVMIDGRNVFDQCVKNYVGAFKKKIGKGI